MKLRRKAAESGAPQKKKQPSSAKKFVFTVLKILIVFIIALSCALAGIAGGAVVGYIRTAPPITAEQLQLKKFTTFIYDINNNEVGQLRGEENRVWADDKEIPQDLKDAFISIEDERFLQHKGIDIKRIMGAAVNLINPKSQLYGASTITQQVIKNITDERQQTLQRKVQEQWRAIQLEKKLEKWQILELYMNVIYMGYNVYGVQSASKLYFGKDVSELDLAECASLAGITNLPGRYDPLTTDGRKKNKERQELTLKKMLELGYININEYDKAIKEELKYNESGKVTVKITSNKSYFIDQVIIDVKKDLMAKGMSEQIALKTIYNNGLKIYTTMDAEVQKAMDDVYKDDKYFPIVNKSSEHPQSAMVIMDKTGQVRGMYGGYGEKKADMILNRATQMKRQPGSSFKPIAVYGPAINERIITPGTVVDDSPSYMEGVDKPRYPENYESGTYSGLTAIRDSIRESKNVVAAKVWKDLLRPDLSLQYIKKVGISRDSERYVSLALGGLRDGVNPLLMASAYTPFANKGVYYEPVTYTKVEDMNGGLIIQKKNKSSIVYDETSAYVMTDMMKDVCSIGTAYPYGTLQDGKMPTAGKTGTTSDYIDKWFVGFSPHYIGATWYGYDNNTGKPIRLQSSEYNQALIIWHDIMEKIHKGLPTDDFPEPSGLVRKDICLASGKTATAACFNDPRGSAIIRYGEVFVKGTEPRDDDKCDVHVTAKVDKDATDMFGRNLLAGPYCPPSSIIEKVFIQRKIQYMPVHPGDPYPQDWDYELPAGEYCNLHGASTVKPDPGKGTQTPVKPGTTTTPPVNTVPQTPAVPSSGAVSGTTTNTPSTTKKPN